MKEGKLSSYDECESLYIVAFQMTQLNDSHHLILVHWIGERNDVIVCLTKNGKRHTTMGRLLPSAVYISYDYGDTFENKTESFALDDKKKSYARLDQFVSHPKYTSHVSMLWIFIILLCLCLLIKAS